MLSKAATAARGVGRISKERTDVVQAEADVEAVRGQHQALEAELAREIEALDASSDATGIEIEAVAVKPRKGDIEVSDVALVWQPA
jgi:outer membrane protein TolC